MGQAMGADLSSVRVHTGAESTSLNDELGATAFTLGSDVFFREGVPDTSTHDGAHLMAHELAHTLQQSGTTGAAIGRIQRRGKRGQGKGKGKGSGKGRPAKGGGGRPPVKAPTATVTTADSAFTRLTPLVDLAAPTKGDSGSLEASVKIPMDPSGSTFLQFDLAGDIERTDDGVEAGFKVAVGYGGEWELLGVTPEVIGQLGGSIESTGSTSAEMLKLISYGYFRQFRETNLLPRELTDYLWGQGGTTGATPGEEANKWGADIEKQVFGKNDKASVGMGIFGAVGGSLGVEDGPEGEVSSKLSSTTTYSKETLESSGSSGGSQLGVPTKEKSAAGLSGLATYYFGRGAERSVGEVERTLETELAVEYEPFSGSAEFGIKLQRALEFELEISATAQLSASQRKPVQIAESIVKALATARGIVSFIRSNQRSIAQYAAELGNTADTIGSYIESFESHKDRLATELEGKVGGKGARSVEVSWSLEYENGTLQQPELTISYVSEVSVEGGLLGVEAEAKVERKRKLVELEWPTV